jgi:hypothetical protein
MVAVATGGPRIEDRDAEYRQRRREIRRELERRGLEDPNPFADLWGWYGYWTQHFGAGEGGGYAARRAHIRQMYEELLEALERLDERQLGTDLQPAQTGWDAVDHQLGQLRQRFAIAETGDDYRAIGLLCRDLFRSLSDATFDEEAHLPDGTDLPGPADAVARLSLVVDAVAPGESNREIRRLLKANFDLANKVQHDQGATQQDAALVAESTVASANLMRILCPAEED